MMRRRSFAPRPGLIAVFATLLCLSAAVSPAYGWGTKEHILLTRLAAIRLIGDPETPEAMKAWLRDASPGLGPAIESQRDYLLYARVGPVPRGADGLAFWAVMPDVQALQDSGVPLDRVRKVEPFGVPERLLHFIDLEYFMPDESRRRYRPDLSNKPRDSDVPRDPSDPRFARAGMLPFRVQQCYQSLVAEIRRGRLVDKPGQFPRDEHASKWAGYLAHYVQDNTQPHHATEDYRSASYFNTNPRTAPNVHADVEYRLVDDEFEDYPELRREFWEALVKSLAIDDPVRTGDPFDATLEVSMRSYDALPLIGSAAVAAYGERGGPRRDFDADAFYRFRGKVGGEEMTVLEMKARQMAWAVRRTERLWRQAWTEAVQKNAEGH
jgi:hypothetical protein